MQGFGETPTPVNVKQPTPANLPSSWLRKQMTILQPPMNVAKSISPDRTRLPSGDSLDNALFNSQRAAVEAFRLLSESMLEEKDSKISMRLSVFNKASEERNRYETCSSE
jgi:hypothetical protein